MTSEIKRMWGDGMASDGPSSCVKQPSLLLRLLDKLHLSLHIDDLNPNNNASFFSGAKAQTGGQGFSQTDMGFVKLARMEEA